ncbi:MAG TPA: hypothetical protein PKH39_10270 [Woeseiaceae bacterium]|nr:hypothetical protein [Woeseiaceae bacterium]
MKFSFSEDKDLCVFAYPPDTKKNILSPVNSPMLVAEISLSAELFGDIKLAVTNQATDLSHIEIVIGSEELTEELCEYWLTTEEFLHDVEVTVDELSIVFNHPTRTEELNEVISEAKRLRQNEQEVFDELD